MYADGIQGEVLYQGDIVNDFPFCLFENNLSLRKNEDGTFIAGEADGDRHLFAVEAKKQQVMILSQTCDVQRRSNVIVCPVYNLQEFITDNTINTERARAIRERRIYYWFYLPQYNALPESIADMQTMIYVPRVEIEKYIPSRIMSLNDLGRHHLAWSLATFFGRPADTTT
jgi:hypothetical protein